LQGIVLRRRAKGDLGREQEDPDSRRDSSSSRSSNSSNSSNSSSKREVVGCSSSRCPREWRGYRFRGDQGGRPGRRRLGSGGNPAAEEVVVVADISGALRAPAPVRTLCRLDFGVPFATTGHLRHPLRPHLELEVGRQGAEEEGVQHPSNSSSSKPPPRRGSRRRPSSKGRGSNRRRQDRGQAVLLAARASRCRR